MTRQEAVRIKPHFVDDHTVRLRAADYRQQGNSGIALNRRVRCGTTTVRDIERGDLVEREALHLHEHADVVLPNCVAIALTRAPGDRAD